MSQLPPGFVLDGAAPAGPASAPYPGVVRGEPKPATPPAPKTSFRTLSPEEASSMGLAPGGVYQVSSEGQINVVSKAPLSKGPGAQQDAATKLADVIAKIDRVALDAYDNSGWGETGFTGSMLRNVPGTAAKDLASNIQTIDANSAFSALAEMRANSPTGAALGSVTEKELELLKSTIANLDPNQSQEQFLQNLGGAKKAYLDMLRRIDPAAAETANKSAGLRFNEDGTVLLVPDTGSEKRDTIDPFGVRDAPPAEGGSGLELLGRGLAEGTGDLIEGAASLPGLIINPVGQALYDAAGYETRYDLGDILRGSLGLPESAPGINRTMRQGAAAALTGGGAARAAGSLFNSGVTGNVLSTIGRTPIRDAAAGAGAAGGGEIGQEIGGVPGQAIGMVAGGLAGYGSASSVNALASTIGRGGGGGSPNALAQAATRQGVDLLPADAGGPVARAVTAGTKASPLSVAPVVKAAQAQQQQFGGAVTRAARSQSDDIDAQTAGESVRRGAEAFTKQTSERGSRLYDKAAAAAKGVKAIRPRKTLEAIDAALARVKQNPAAPEGLVKQLTRFRSKIESGVSIQGLRDARSSLSQGVYDGQLRSGQDQAMWRDILGNVAEDIDDGLRSVGQDTAADMFRSADEFWAKRVEHIDQVLQPIIGKDGAKGGDQVLAAVESMARGRQGGGARLSRLLANMPEPEARQVRATIVDRLGKSTPGAQNAEGTAFSASTFLTNWSKMTPQAKASLFGEGKLRGDLNDLAKLAEGMKASQSMANFSNTGVAIGSNAGIGAVAFMAHPALAIIGGASQYATGRLMASPGFARMLARTAKMPPEAARRTIKEQLGVIAGRDSLVATDARGLQQFLAEAVSKSPQRAAAEDEGNRRQIPPA